MAEQGVAIPIQLIAQMWSGSWDGGEKADQALLEFAFEGYEQGCPTCEDWAAQGLWD